jgi:hypothetical protein
MMRRILLGAAFAASCLPAATITAPFSGTGGTVSGTVNTPAPNNNNVLGLSPNTVNITEGWFGVTGSVAFQLPQSAGSTEYYFTKTVTNNSAFLWTSFGMAMGCGPTGSTDCGGGLNGNPLTLDYDVAPTSSAGGSLIASNGYSLLWAGLNVAPGQSVTFNFSVDTCSGCGGAWQIIQTANVAAPEPGTMLLCAAGLVGVGVYRKRRD